MNRARAPEFMPVLGVSASVAEAIVQRRAAQGPYKTIEDLKQVPGLDAARVDAERGTARLLRHIASCNGRRLACAPWANPTLA